MKLFCSAECFFERYDTELFPLRAGQTNLAGTNLIINSGRILANCNLPPDFL